MDEKARMGEKTGDSFLYFFLQSFDTRVQLCGKTSKTLTVRVECC